MPNQLVQYVKSTSFDLIKIKIEESINKIKSLECNNTALFFQSLLYFISFVLSFSLDNGRSLIGDLLCLLQTEVEHFSQNLDDLDFLTWINWCELDFPNLLDNLFIVLGIVLFILWDEDGGQQVSLFPIFLYPLILVHELQRSVLVTVQWVNFIGNDTLSTFQGSFGLQLVEVR